MKTARTDSLTGAGKGSLKSYGTGFLLSIVLTVIPFVLVMSGAVSRGVAISGICGAGIVQILVHLRYFLHLDGSSEERWNVLALLFTTLILAIFVVGTLWVLSTLNSRMM